MGINYGWFLSIDFDKAGVLEFVRTVPNEGLTERIDETWVDVCRARDGSVTVEPADVAAFAEELAKGRSGTLSYDVASALELGECIAVETSKTATRPLDGAMFRGYRCVDLAKILASAKRLLDEGEFDDGPDSMLGSLCGCLKRALDLHIAVVFGK